MAWKERWFEGWLVDDDAGGESVGGKVRVEWLVA